MTAEVIDSFGVTDDDVTTEVDYVASGSIVISIGDETSEDEIADAIIASITDLVDVHPRDVTIVSVDLETGEVR
eukprot:UN12078